MYRIKVIDPEGPGETIFEASTEKAAQYWLTETGTAYDYHFGVCVMSPDGLVDCCGTGQYEPVEDCWGLTC